MKRTWQIEAQPVVDEEGRIFAQELDRGQVGQLFADVEAIGNCLGGSFALAPVREKLGEEDFITVGWVAQWTSASPSIKRPAPEPAPEPEPVSGAVEG